MRECICGCGIVIPDGAVFIPDKNHLLRIKDRLEKSKLIISNGEVKLV